jgi:hypothetical protein
MKKILLFITFVFVFISTSFAQERGLAEPLPHKVENLELRDVRNNP